MVRCVAPGCTSGYDSNPDKFNFFAAPKNELSTWQRAIPRANFTLKPTDRICSRHFLSDDIAWKRELLAPDGVTVLGVSEYKIPRLRQGAVPVIFTNHPIPSSKSKFVKPRRKFFKKNFTPKTDLNGKSEKASKKRKDDVDEKIEEKIKIREQRRKLLIDNMRNALFPQNQNYLFDTLFKNEKSIDIPSGWWRHDIESDDIKIIEFSQLIVKKVDDVMNTVCIKKVVVQENMHVNIFFLHSQIDKSKINLKSEVLSSTAEVEHTLKVVHELKVCNGCLVDCDPKAIKTSYCYSDKQDILRHNECPLYLPKDCPSEKCEKCLYAERNLARIVKLLKDNLELLKTRSESIEEE